MKILQNIGQSISKKLSQAIEAYIAVALVKDYGLDILNQSEKNCKVQMIVGVNLPTPLQVLKALRKRYASGTRIYQGDFFPSKGLSLQNEG